MMARTKKRSQRRGAGCAVGRAAACVGLCIAFMHCGLVRGEEFEVTLQVRQGKQKVQATSQLPVGKKTAAITKKKTGIKPRPKLGERNRSPSRPVLHVKAGQTVWVSWQITETGSTETFKDLLLHIFVVQEAKAGQQTVPKLSDDAAYESALTMDFTPKDRAEGRFQFKFERPGNYLVRAETIGLAVKLLHEFHATADVVVGRAAKPKP